MDKKLYASSQVTQVSPLYDWCDPAQVAANRGGQLTLEQQTILEKMERESLLDLCGFILLLGITLSVLFYYIIHSFFALLFLIISFGLCVLIRRGRLTRKARMRSQIAAKPIDADECFIIWNNRRRRYVVQLTTKQLKLKKNLSSCALLPGPYRCYYLAKERTLLSAEPISNVTGMASFPLETTGATHEEQALQLYQKAFCDLFDFSLGDLTYNRQGQLSDKQLQGLSKENTPPWRPVIFALSLLLLLMLLLGLPGVIKLSPTEQFSAVIGLFLVFLCILLFMSLALIIGFSLAIYKYRKAKRSIHEKNPVKQVLGEITLRVETVSSGGDSGGTTTYYYYDIGDMSFSVPGPGPYITELSDIQYRIFYIPGLSNVLLSIEPFRV